MTLYVADLPLYLELAAAHGGHVLEIACGSGRVLIPLAKAGHQVVGLGASPHMLAVARDKLNAAGPAVMARATLVRGDMRDFELGDTFDPAIVAVMSFAYLIERADRHGRP